MNTGIDMIIEDIDWAEILFADLFYLKTRTGEEKTEIRDLWMRDFLYSDYHFPETREVDAVFFRSLVRNDYRGLFHAVIDASGIGNRLVIEDYQHRTQPTRLNLEASRFMTENMDLFYALDIPDPLDRACGFIRVCKYAFILKKLARIKFKALICFADMQPVEHLLARYFRGKGVTTVTLQHGLYVDYGDLDTVNVINYLHQPSEYFLSWGPNTSRLIARNHPENTPVDCGKPLIFNADSAEPGNNGVPYISVFLDQKIFNAQNERMLEIVIAHARRTGRAVRVRFHPSIRKSDFLRKYPDIKEQLHFRDAEFVVGHTSSLIYEAITLGCRVFRFESEVPGIPLPETCSFQTLAQLEARTALPQPEDLTEEFFCATGESALRRYSKFFRDVLPGLVANGTEARLPVST